MFDRSKLESLRDVSVTRIGDTLSYGFPQTDSVPHSCNMVKLAGYPNSILVGGGPWRKRLFVLLFPSVEVPK